MIRSRYTIGLQPCADFEPQRESNGSAEWDNTHECFAPFDDSKRPRCGGTVSFCVNCYSDHHIDGHETCPQPRKEG